MISDDIVEQLFEVFKDQYGISIADQASVFDGQRDMLEFVMKIGRQLERRYFCELGSGYQGTKVKVGGSEYRFKGNRNRTIHGLFGKVQLRRAYYVGPRGGGYYPLDEQLSVEGHTPGLQYFLALFTGQEVYQKSLDRFHQIFRPEGVEKLSLRKALDMDYQLGEGLQGLRQQEIEQALVCDQPVEKQQLITGVMAVSIDATKVRQKLGEQISDDGKRSYEIQFKDAKVAAVSAVVWDNKREEAHCVESSYVSGIEYADDFYNRIWVEMQRRGSDLQNQRLVFLADGANWIWDRVGELSNRGSIQILDFYHASEHLSGLCKLLFGEQSDEYWQYYNRWTKMLLSSKGARLICALKKMLLSAGSAEKTQGLIREIHYFEANLDRMDYRRYQRMRLPIGSGTVESACKNVIGGRLKQGGMTWSERGADGMLQIRSSQESRRFLWDFRQLLAA